MGIHSNLINSKVPNDGSKPVTIIEYLDLPRSHAFQEQHDSRTAALPW